VLKSEKARSKMVLRFISVYFYLFVFAGYCPMVCVTRAGAGGGTPSDRENAEA